MRHAEVNQDGKFLDANTHQPIEGKYDIGHKYGHEFWREEEAARRQGMSQSEFNDHMNNDDFYQIEDRGNNRSHQFEMPRDMEAERSVSGADMTITQTSEAGTERGQTSGIGWADGQSRETGSFDQGHDYGQGDQGMEM